MRDHSDDPMYILFNIRYALRHLANLEADTSIKDVNGRTVVEWAQELNQTEVVSLLESKL